MAKSKTPKNVPVRRIRIGGVSAAIWRNRSDNGNRAWHNVTLTKTYQDNKTGEWVEAKNYGLVDLCALREVLTRAIDAIVLLEQPESDRVSFGGRSREVEPSDAEDFDSSGEVARPSPPASELEELNGTANSESYDGFNPPPATNDKKSGSKAADRAPSAATGSARSQKSNAVLVTPVSPTPEAVLPTAVQVSPEPAIIVYRPSVSPRRGRRKRGAVDE